MMCAHKRKQIFFCIVATMALIIGPVMGVESGEPCASCEECEAKLASGLYSRVVLTEDIIDHVGVCIGLESVDNDVEFDCNGYLIDGDGVDSNPDRGISIKHGSGFTITNCVIRDFASGVFLVDSSYNIISLNIFFSNRIGLEITHSESNLFEGNTVSGSSTGVKISDSNFNFLTLNFICDNEIWDIYFANGTDNVGDGNTCDMTSFWVEAGSPGCTFSCPFFADGFESGCCSAWIEIPASDLKFPEPVPN